MALGDVAVSAKRSGTEANGKLLNYMAMGLSTVAYDQPVAREVLGEAGVFAPTGDTAQLADACLRLLEDAGERKWRGDALRERAMTEFAWSTIAARLVAIYQAVREERGTRR